MALKIYKMTFQKAHFGDGELNDSQSTFDAARLFSALVIEAIKFGNLEDFATLAKSDEFTISDSFPIIENDYFIPKPIGYPKAEQQDQVATDLKRNRQLTKTIKKMSFIPYKRLEAYINNEFDKAEVSAYTSTGNPTQPVMKKGEDPYEVGVTTFRHPLYIIASQSELFDQLMTSLQYSGLGGKRSSGYGSFELEIMDVPESLRQLIVFGDQKKVPLAIALTSSLPKESEMETTLTDAFYLVKKASGFAYSTTTDELLRKQDLYKFKSGSTFTTTYEGNIVDVQPDNFAHPVWHYAKGMFLVPNVAEVGEMTNG